MAAFDSFLRSKKLFLVLVSAIILLASFLLRTPLRPQQKVAVHKSLGSTLTEFDKKVDFYTQEISIDTLKHYLKLSKEGHFSFQNVVASGGSFVKAREIYDLRAYAYEGKDPEGPLTQLPIEATRITRGRHAMKMTTERDINLSVFRVKYSTVQALIDNNPGMTSIIFRPRVCSLRVNHIYYIAYADTATLPELDNCIIETRSKKSSDTLSKQPLLILYRDAFLLNPAPPRKPSYAE
ncbi:MAG TPA: hypothetical protein VF609_15060 [Flavisolibacter sp.]|jgi:hypothetical protein